MQTQEPAHCALSLELQSSSHMVQGARGPKVIVVLGTGAFRDEFIKCPGTISLQASSTSGLVPFPYGLTQLGSWKCWLYHGVPTEGQVTVSRHLYTVSGAGIQLQGCSLRRQLKHSLCFQGSTAREEAAIMVPYVVELARVPLVGV